MSVVQLRGGVPHVVRDNIDTVGRKVKPPFYISHLKVRNQGGAPVRLYFTEADYTADANYVVIPISAAATPYGEWEGPVETTAGDRECIWLKSPSGTNAVELVAFQRRG